MVEAEVLPSYPIEAVSRGQVAVLDYLDRTNTDAYTAKKSDLIAFAEEAGLSLFRQTGHSIRHSGGVTGAHTGADTIRSSVNV
jgi:hypothetical protein